MIPTSINCPECGRVCPGPTDGTAPPPGSIAMCTACSWLGVFGEDGGMHAADADLRAKLLTLPEVVQAMTTGMAFREHLAADRRVLVRHGRRLIAAAPFAPDEDALASLLESWAEDIQGRGFHTHPDEEV